MISQNACIRHFSYNTAKGARFKDNFKIYTIRDKFYDHIDIINLKGYGIHSERHKFCNHIYLPVKLPQVLSLPIRTNLRSEIGGTGCKAPVYMYIT